MKIQRFFGLMLAMALFTGCSQEKKNAPPVAANPGSVAKPTDVPQSEVAKPAADEKKAATTDGKKANVDDLLTKARLALIKQNAPGVIAAAEEVVAADPKNRDGLFLLIQGYQMQGNVAIQSGNTMAASEPLLKSAKYIKQLRAAYPKLTLQEAELLPVCLYNEACVLAMTGETDKAMTALEDACDSGFADLGRLSDDHDLDKLRSLPRFKTFLQSATVKLVAKAKEHARELIAAQKPFDFNFSLPDLDGKTVALKDFNGHVLIADIWGTWCPPCKMEIPYFVDLLKKYEGKGLRMVGINYEKGDPKEATKLIKEFAKTNKMNYPCLIGDEKTSSQVPNLKYLPTTLFLDRTGKVRLCVEGYHSQADLDAIIQELLDEKTASVK